ncbi:hypothetical protein C8A05DRAFT_37882 [Staphylotrichum tortipilum]|uniref:Uncharacterized protein n=1 Tax=Staphylotrichum tortipilum TaxID=2831512 RepID=A0AAN6RQA4_9PEZI|nr:hypothetical protein C8A05DRAFT_37882 [Staphylotrichum longicolle]
MSTTSSSASSFRPTPSASVSSSFIFTDVPTSSDRDDDDDVASLPSISSSILDGGSDYDDDLARSDAQREWEASLEQLQLLLTMIIMPFAGKFLGRKFAYYGWARYMEWFHNVDIQWTGKKATSSMEAAASL